MSWAFAEAAEFARRYDPRAKAYYNRKAQRTKPIVAQHALSHKLARAAFYMMKNQEPFMAEKAFGHLPVHMLAGTVPIDKEKTLKAVRHGMGTPVLHKFSRKSFLSLF